MRHEKGRDPREHSQVTGQDTDTITSSILPHPANSAHAATNGGARDG